LPSVSKKCIKCRKIKNQTSFYRDNSRKDKLYPCCKQCENLRSSKRRKNPLTKEETRYRWLKSKYKLSREAYFEIVNIQNSRCAICQDKIENFSPSKKKGQKKYFVVDHDHRTGKNRGLLCKPCNSGIGHLRDSICILEKAIVYLKKYEESE
jgi:hypothetical protein